MCIVIKTVTTNKSYTNVDMLYFKQEHH